MDAFRSQAYSASLTRSMIHFAPFRFDEVDLTLWRGPEPLALTRKAAHLLTCLLIARGHWVSKSDILASVWPDTHVHPDNIKVLVREIRLALHDDAGSPRYIRSEVGRGYAFVAETTDRPNGSSGDADLPLFVNRAGELAALLEAFDAVRAGSTRVVLITGELGIGKTALCDMFLRVARASARVHAGAGECLSHPPAAEPLLPWLDAVRACCRSVPSLIAPLTVDAPGWAARAAQGSSASALDAADIRSLVGELPAALAALAHDVPLVIVLDDLQWADAATLGTVAELARHPRMSKCLVIATASLHGPARDPIALAALDAILRRTPSSFVLNLASWSALQVERYVDARFGPGCLTDLTRTLYEITGGNPAMLALAAESLVASGIIRGRANQWQREASIDAVQEMLPRVLAAVVGAQIDRLSPDERTLLEAVAAAGMEFTAASAALAADTSEPEAERLLNLMADRRLLIRRTAEVVSHRPVRAAAFRFLHPMHLDLLTERAPITQQIRSARRLAAMAERAVIQEA